MKKNIGVVLLFILLCTLLICFGGVGSKTAGVPTIYAATAVLSLATAVGYQFLIRKRDPWFILLFASVLVVNTGYLTLSLSGTLSAALWANRLSYLGSVFLPLSMLMIILNTCRLKYEKYLPKVLLGVSSVIFLIAASPGILDVYYPRYSVAIIAKYTSPREMKKDRQGVFPNRSHKIFLFFISLRFIQKCLKSNFERNMRNLLMSCTRANESSLTFLIQS